MNPAALLDLEALLRPVVGDAPAGPNLRYEKLYDELRELRREDDAVAPRGVWRSKLKTADWSAVIVRTQAALREQTKDLQIAAWLTEALTAQHGLAGAAAGFGLLAGLVERFWPTLWPESGDDPDEDSRLPVLEWLDGKLAERLLLQPVASLGDLPVTWHEQASLQRRRAGAQGRVAPEDRERGAAIAKAIAATPTETYQGCFGDVASAAAALDALVEALRRASSAPPPAFAQLRATLMTMEAFLRAELAGRGMTLATPSEPTGVVAADTKIPAPPHPAREAPAAGAGITSREAAYRRLEEVAAYLEAAEPHSPVPALLRRAIGWGQMRLPDLLAELMREEGGPLRLLRLNPSPRAE